MITVEESIAAARDLIADPAHWTKGTAARDANGNSIQLLHWDACSWCIAGAVYRACYGLPSGHRQLVFQELRGRLPRGMDDLSFYNDDPATTHADILNLLEPAK